MSSSTHAPHHGVLKKETMTWRAIFAVGFAVFLMIALCAQTVGFKWRSWLPGAEGTKSLTGGVKAAVYTFMSNLI